MNIFPGSSVGFRHGRALADVGLSHHTPQLHPVVTAGGAVDGSSAPAPLPLLDQPSADKRGGGGWVTDLSTLLAAAQQSRHAASPPRPHPTVPFPNVPYYGIARRCEVHIDVGVDGSRDDDDDEASRAAAVSRRREPLRNPSSTSARLGHIQRCLHETVRRHGSVYIVSSGHTLAECVLAPSSPAASAGQTCLTYGAYADSLLDAFRRFSALRQASASAVTHHTFYLRLLGHPLWRDVSALLCVEGGRLLVCVIASSRTTQSRLADACARAGARLDWVGGAALTAEPRRLGPGEVNPVWVVWDALMQLPILTPPPAESSSAAGATDEAAAAAGVRAVLRDIQQSAATLAGMHVSLLSSLSFEGATRCGQVGRVVDVAPVLAHEDLPRVSPTSASSTTTSGGRAAAAAAVVAHRFIWRLIPPPSSTPASCAVVLPHLLAHLVACLVEECQLESFAVHLGGPADMSTGAGTGAVAAAAAAAASSGGVGVRLVHSTAPSLLTLRGGPSSSTCLAFSRLSGAAWVDAETREGVRLALPDEEEQDDDAEMEFEVTSVLYERPRPCTRLARRRRRTATPDVGVEVNANADGSGDGTLVQPTRWGSFFTLTTAVRRLIVADALDE
ncbi:hypothetical protein NESM_000434800 [Novymonas esmeraldas]|uniref:Uncharacterized protein n=1 Tax=Novymonas esmeraldas TaxID=1808958 RepID=A0AAW0ELY2_9TRYP